MLPVLKAPLYFTMHNRVKIYLVPVKNSNRSDTLRVKKIKS